LLFREARVPSHHIAIANKEDFFNKIYPNEEIKFVNADVMIKDQQKNIKAE